MHRRDVPPGRACAALPGVRRRWLRGMALLPTAAAWSPLASLLSTPLPAAAQPAPPRPGSDYRVLPSPQPAPADRIEVLEFFYYGCPFCSQLEPLLVEWLARQPADIAFGRIPVIARDAWAPLGRLYYVLAELGALDRLHAAAFRAIHAGSLQLGQPEVALDWAARNGLDRTRFSDAWRSPTVDSQVARARRLTDDYDVQSTPSIVVDGRLLTSSGLTAGVPALLPMVDRLVAIVRAGRAGTPKS
ncbi:MAG: thiol:disulfide interchange protein DsbA/DsbL [bacterium]|jgi:thiol:disulfide interchange protein DsbA|nr:thiol:disulfide interchange protein DsbA/DsbL [Betaproteobacteria bacterium]